MVGIGSRLRQARESAQLSQIDAAAELGVTKGALSAWENDKNFPQLQTFVELCRLYGVSADALLLQGETGDAARLEETRAQYVSDETDRLLVAIGKLSAKQRKGLMQFLDIE